MKQTDRTTGTWLGILTAAAREMPAKVAYSYLPDGDGEPRQLSYAQLEREAQRVAASLQQRGMAGERVVLWYPSGLDYLVAFFGCLYAGAIAVPAYPPVRQRRSAERVLAIIEDAAPACALTTTQIRDRLPAELLVGGQRPLATDSLDAGLEETWREPAVGPDSIAFLQYTSGSTARPRGVVLTHQNLIANSAMISELFGTSDQTRLVSWLPMYHDMGLIGSILQALYCNGTTTLMSPAAFVQDPARWLRTVSHERATISGGPNFAYDLCVDRITDAERAELDLSSWEVAFNGAEPIRARTLDRFSRAFADCGFRASAMMPCYGLAEATLLVSARRPGTGARTDGDGRVSCGITPPAARVEIVDPATGSPCPPGQAGEVWVASPGVGQGYWNQPAATAAVFGARMDGPAGPPFLRTGDLGYVLDGELYVNGRLKDLIIVRGRNHYPQDLEQTVDAADPRLRAGGAAAFSVPGDEGEELVVVAEVGRRHLNADLAGLAQRVYAAIAAEHEVRPWAVAVIRPGDLPKTSSGKVQRRACREAYLSGSLEKLAVADGGTLLVSAPGSGQQAPGVADAPLPPPGTAARILMVGDVIRSEIAGLAQASPDQVPLDVPLVSLGLDSMAVITLQHRIVTRLGLEVSLEEALSWTAADLIEMLARRAAVESGPARPAVVPPEAAGERAADFPLTPGQSALWVQHRVAPGSPAHLLAVSLRVAGPLDPDALRCVIELLARRHEALRTTFPVAGEGPVARVHPWLAPRFTVTDAAGWDDARLDAATAQAAHEPFDVAAGPLLRVSVFTRGAAEHRVVISLDHLVCDLWSLELLLGELNGLYPEVLAGVQEPAAALPAPGAYSAFACAQDSVPGEVTQQLRAYWRERLGGAPPLLPLPTRPVPSSARDMRAGEVSFTLDACVTADLAALARRLGTTSYAVLLAAYQVLLSQWSGQDELLVGSPAHGRGDAAHRNTVGLFVNMLVLRGRLAPGRTVADLIMAAQAEAHEALSHAGLPFSHLVEELRPARDPSRSPLIQAALSWQRPAGGLSDALSAMAVNLPGVSATVGGLAVETLSLPAGGAQFDLVLTLAEVDGRLAGQLRYDAGLFDEPAALRSAAHYAQLVAAFTANPDARLDSLPVLGRPGTASGGTASPARVAEGGPVTRPVRGVLELFADQVAARPAGTAVICGEQSLTYAELDSAATRLARQLRRAGVGPQDIVALLLDRSVDIVVAIIGVLKSGGAYLPIDPAHPADRQQHILRGAAPTLVITRGKGPDGYPVIDLAAPAEEPGPVGPLPDTCLDRLAYVIYTSGSSGQPKGVAVGHRSLASLLAATAQFDFGETDVWTLFHSYAFDFSVWEIWGALAHGGTLVVVPAPASMSAEEFWSLLDRHRVTVLNQTPAVFRELTVAHPERLARLAVRHIIFGGEKVEPSHLAAWRAHGNPDTQLTNMYGITEITVHGTYWRIGEPAPDEPIAIGEPVRGTELCLLSEDGALVAGDAPGEICVSGAGLAWGYLNQPALTATRFTPHPALPGRRMYRSGDLARRRADGTLEYLGRMDEQVKINGYRIEPGEIVAAVTAHPAVRDAVVVADTGATGTAYLVAYYVAADGAAASSAELRRYLRDYLPLYMIPGIFVPISSIPLTVNGKVDRRALPPAVAASCYAEPASGTERGVAGLVAELIAVSRVGRRDDLFDLGWNSLLMVRLAARIQEAFAVDVPLQELFADPTVERIAALIDQGAAGPDPRATRPITRVDRSRYQLEAGTTGLPAAMRPGR
jgi:amino acid adenylation domain-containing protein